MKKRPMGRTKQERAKLLHKYKREMKGAMREIRRDKSFLAKLKLKETLTSDLERQQKVREIYGSAANQQAEFHKLSKHKKK
nr:unnamed protein product [Timema monikensis]CAD7592266.1 unnamed protein product [Timema genevievae]